MIHLMPYDGLGYAIHFLVGVVIYTLFNRWPISNILILICVLAAGKEAYDFFTDGSLDIWDFMFSIWGVLAAHGSMAIFKDLAL